MCPMECVNIEVRRDLLVPFFGSIFETNLVGHLRKECLSRWCLVLSFLHVCLLVGVAPCIPLDRVERNDWCLIHDDPFVEVFRK